MKRLSSNYKHNHKWHHKRCRLIIVLNRTIIDRRWRGVVLWMCMPLSNIKTSMFRLFVVFFNKLICHCCISFTSTTGMAFNTWWRNLTDSVTIIINLCPHQYSAKLVALTLSIAFQFINYCLFYLEVIIINIYTISSCKVFFDNPDDDTRLIPFSAAIFVFPTHW